MPTRVGLKLRKVLVLAVKFTVTPDGIGPPELAECCRYLCFCRLKMGIDIPVYSKDITDETNQRISVRVATFLLANAFFLLL